MQIFPVSNRTSAPSSGGARAVDLRAGLPSRALLRLLRVYKILISPLFAGSCRYLPSCSDYMAEAVTRHGAGLGFILGLKRLSRCHPFGGSGFDPVPVDRPRFLKF